MFLIDFLADLMYYLIERTVKPKMTSIGNKEVFAKNLARYVERSGKTQKELSELLGVATSTFNDWMKAKKYPRIDKIEMLANIFGCLKSDLIEDKTEMQKNNDVISDIIIRLRTDGNYLDVCSLLKDVDPDQIASVKQMLTAFLK